MTPRYPRIRLLPSTFFTRTQTRHGSARPPSQIQQPQVQAYPLTGYYLELLTHPLTPANAAPPRSLTPATTATASTPQASTTLITSPPAAITTLSTRSPSATTAISTRPADATTISTIPTPPPRPIEPGPDDCCMSGCVNCVLATYAEELAEWRRLEGVEDMAEERKEKLPAGMDAFLEMERRLANK